MGVLFFGINGFFATVLILMVMFATGYAVFMKNPDTRYQPMRDDRGSFIKSATQLNQELDALGATARGDMVQTSYNKARDLDDDDDSYSSNSLNHHDATKVPLPPSTANSNRSPSRHGESREPPRSPIDPSMPLFPSDGRPRHGEPTPYIDTPHGMYNGYNDSSRPGADLPLLNTWTDNKNQAAAHGQEQQMYSRTGSLHSNSNYRQQNNSSPWQRGAGYDH